MSPFKTGELLQQAQKMRGEVQRIQMEVSKKTIEATAGGGMVKVTANGQQEILSIVIDPEVLKMNDREMLQDLVRAGVNQAIETSKQMMADEMEKLTAGFGPLASMFTGG